MDGGGTKKRGRNFEECDAVGFESTSPPAAVEAGPPVSTECGRQFGAPRASSVPSALSLLKRPSARDIRRGRRHGRALDAPLAPFDYLVVLDFEWTCDNRPGFGPSEIIEFPSVLVRCSPKPVAITHEFQQYCRPEINPILTDFCRQLTAIRQSDVDDGVSLREALRRHEEWLRSVGVLDPTKAPPRSCDTTPNKALQSAFNPRFAIVTWSDADVAFALHSQCKRLSIPRPAYFDRWINLKLPFRQHYKREPRGGLENVVRSLHLSFDGRAHSGIVDCRNTAKICVQMMQQGFRFCRTTRGFDVNGEVLGSMAARRRHEAANVAKDDVGTRNQVNAETRSDG